MKYKADGQGNTSPVQSGQLLTYKPLSTYVSSVYAYISVNVAYIHGMGFELDQVVVLTVVLSGPFRQDRQMMLAHKIASIILNSHSRDLTSGSSDL